MKSAFAYLACCLIFSAIDALSSWHISSRKSKDVRERTYWIYRLDDWSIKQLSWTARVPLLVALFKIQAIQMPDHAGHSDAALAPWLCKGKVELVVFYIGIAIYVTLEMLTANAILRVSSPTHHADILTSSCEMMCHGLGDGRLLSDAEDL